MDCLSNLVGLKGVSEEDKIYFLDQIGLTNSQLQDLLPSSYGTVLEWLDDVISLCSKELVTDVINGIHNSMKIITTLETSSVGQITDNKIERTHDDHVGIFFDSWDQKEYLKLVINKISLFTNHDGEIPVKIINMKTGEVLKTVTITCEAGKVSSSDTMIEIQAPNRDIQIGVVYDATGITSYDVRSYGSCSSCSKGYKNVSVYSSVYAIDLESPFLTINKSSSQDTGGMIVEFSWQCDLSGWTCTIANRLGLPMLYKVAHKLLLTSIDSLDQFSDQTTTNYERNIERKDSFEFQFGTELNKVLSSTRYPIGKCFNCATKTFILTRTP